MPDFHSKSFDDETKLKLAIFRRYIGEWLPVFLTKSPKTSSFRQVNIYDFFAGPGHDDKGNPGSPIVIVQEIRKCYENAPSLADNVKLRLVLNDDKQSKIDQLEIAVQAEDSPTDCDIQYSALPFHKALQQRLPEIARRDSANLVIMDQCGVTEVTAKVVQELAQCDATDFLFFISSAFIKRFPELGQKFNMAAEEMAGMDYNTFHRDICEYFRMKLQGQEYFLAPFSIKKGSNIYGVIFGSGHLLGLRKFLSTCWSLDPVTGEANYNIDRDGTWDDQQHGQRSMFPEADVVTKIDVFGKDLTAFVADTKPDNRELYKFCLTHGFLAKHARELLKTMQADGKLVVTEISNGQAARKNTFYLTIDSYYKKPPKVRFSAARNAT